MTLKYRHKQEIQVELWEPLSTSEMLDAINQFRSQAKEAFGEFEEGIDIPMLHISHEITSYPRIILRAVPK